MSKAADTYSVLGSHCWAQASLGAVQVKRGQQEQTLREGFSEREAASLLHLLLLQQPLLACPSDGSWLPRNLMELGEHWTDYARTGNSNLYISETIRRERTQLNREDIWDNQKYILCIEEMQWTIRWNTALAHVQGNSSETHYTIGNGLCHRVPLRRKQKKAFHSLGHNFFIRCLKHGGPNKTLKKSFQLKW